MLSDIFAYMCIQLEIGLLKPQDNLKYSFSDTVHFSYKQGLSLAWNLPTRLGWLASKALRFSGVLLLWCWDYKYVLPSLDSFLMWVLDLNSDPCKASILKLSHLSSPFRYILNGIYQCLFSTRGEKKSMISSLSIQVTIQVF